MKIAVAMEDLLSHKNQVYKSQNFRMIKPLEKTLSETFQHETSWYHMYLPPLLAGRVSLLTYENKFEVL